MAKQMPREDLLTPIHKGIRSMIYELGTKLQKTDFTDVSATEAIIAQLRHNLQSANSTCIVCLMHEHAGHEEEDLFPRIPPNESKVVDTIMQEHMEVTRQLVEIYRVSDQLLGLKDNEQRIQMGAKLNRMANNLLAFYLTHMNNEEANLLPLMWKYMTDDEMRGIRAKIQMATPPERYAEWMRWVMSSLNVNELIGMFSGMKAAAPPQVLQKMMQLAEQNVDSDTWNTVKLRVNL
jgi:hypothetical protein